MSKTATVSSFSDYCKNPKVMDANMLLPEDCQKIVKTDTFKNMMAMFARYWTVEDCEESPKSLFIFGDNDICKGVGGQAVIRNCKNSIGIPTKKLPNNNPTSFYVDAEYKDNCQKIFDAVVRIIRASVDYEELVFPSDGFGTGLAKLAEKAPKTLAFMDKLIDDVFGIDYADIRENGLRVNVDIPKEVSKTGNQ
ncbi:hypothetical protein YASMINEVIRUS_1021 [Yasminevirus sp. GU-2018]|uniref:DUF7831 domain-containing protein n=1 Tax=Yasminevirus sp. GU-2018 TaxID=2420051 RepID=A0A5K0U977_9VIRU|nr:hypothetical protein YASMINEVIRUS_1021 [Yasminevirus sp. GU-2018]